MILLKHSFTARMANSTASGWGRRCQSSLLSTTSWHMQYAHTAKAYFSVAAIVTVNCHADTKLSITWVPSTNTIRSIHYHYNSSTGILKYDNTCCQKQPLHRHFQHWWLVPATYCTSKNNGIISALLLHYDICLVDAQDNNYLTAIIQQQFSALTLLVGQQEGHPVCKK